MRPELRVCYADTPLRHYTWFALYQTLCGRSRSGETPFSTASVECIVCIAVAFACPPGAHLSEQLKIAIRMRGIDF